MVRSMFIARSSMLLVIALLATTFAPGAEDLVLYRVMVISSSELELGTYSTYEEASKAALQWAGDNPNNYALWRIDTVLSAAGRKIKTVYGRVQTVRDAKRAVDKAQKIGREGWLKAYQPRERRFLDSLREYKTAIQDASRRVFDARNTLVSGTQGMMQRDFRDINNLIGEFNREADTYNEAARGVGFDTIDRIPPVTTTITFQNPGFVDVGSAPDSSSPSLSGKKYSGTIGSAKASIEFKAGNFSVSGDLEGQGRWRQGGNGIHMETETAIYRGVINEDKIKGYRYFKDHHPYEKWSVQITSKKEEPKADVLGAWHFSSDLRPIGIQAFVLQEGGVAYQHIRKNARYGKWVATGGTITVTLPDHLEGTGLDPEVTWVLVLTGSDQGYDQEHPNIKFRRDTRQGK